MATASTNAEPLSKPNTNVLTLLKNNGMNISSMQDFGLFVSLTMADRSISWWEPGVPA
jgi:hypothetical protein